MQAISSRPHKANDHGTALGGGRKERKRRPRAVHTFILPSFAAPVLVAAGRTYSNHTL